MNTDAVFYPKASKKPCPAITTYFSTTDIIENQILCIQVMYLFFVVVFEISQLESNSFSQPHDEFVLDTKQSDLKDNMNNKNPSEQHFKWFYWFFVR